MPTLLPIDQMTRRQQLRAMEELWQSLTRDGDDLSVPAWHRAELRRRKSTVESGQAKPAAWSAAKERIRKRAHGA